MSPTPKEPIGPREGSRDSSREGSREGSRDSSREGSREGSRDVPRPAPLDARTTLAEVMTRSPLTIQAGETLAHAYDAMKEHGLRHLPVLDGQRLVGVVSLRDLYVVEAVAPESEPPQHVAQAMEREIYTVAPGDRVRDVARTMGEHKYGCAVVVDVGRVVGVFTSTDALALLSRAMS
jgi:CBS domain-containing protein